MKIEHIEKINQLIASQKGDVRDKYKQDIITAIKFHRIGDKQRYEMTIKIIITKLEIELGGEYIG